jgi:hypothetical protein
MSGFTSESADLLGVQDTLQRGQKRHVFYTTFYSSESARCIYPNFDPDLGICRFNTGFTNSLVDSHRLHTHRILSMTRYNRDSNACEKALCA